MKLRYLRNNYNKNKKGEYWFNRKIAKNKEFFEECIKKIKDET